MVITLRPQTAGITHETFADYMPGKPVNEAERQEILEFSQSVNDQDEILLNNMQISRSMDVSEQTQMSSAWDQAPAWFQKAWLSHMF